MSAAIENQAAWHWSPAADIDPGAFDMSGWPRRWAWRKHGPELDGEPERDR